VSETKKVRLEKVLKHYVDRYQKLLELVGKPEFIHMNMMGVKVWDREVIQIGENWHSATVEPTREGQLLIKPDLYFDFEGLYGSTAYEKEFDKFDEDTFCLIDFMESETQGSVMISMLSETFTKFSYGRLKVMFEEYIKTEKLNDIDWFKDSYNDFLANKDGVIHLVISGWDQDTRGDIRSFKFDTLEHEGATETEYKETDRHNNTITSIDIEYLEFGKLEYAINRLVERVDLSDLVSTFIYRDGSYLD
tara:strand:+ start:4999 stop:5745 length:747 start_codon:yes stop_codon:yes gene_type:complete